MCIHLYFQTYKYNSSELQGKCHFKIKVMFSEWQGKRLLKCRKAIFINGFDVQFLIDVFYLYIKVQIRTFFILHSQKATSYELSKTFIILCCKEVRSTNQNIKFTNVKCIYHVLTCFHVILFFHVFMEVFNLQ